MWKCFLLYFPWNKNKIKLKRFEKPNYTEGHFVMNWKKGGHFFLFHLDFKLYIRPSHFNSNIWCFFPFSLIIRWERLFSTAISLFSTILLALLILKKKILEDLNWNLSIRLYLWKLVKWSTWYEVLFCLAKTIIKYTSEECNRIFF